MEARAIFAALCAKLDALSHLAYRRAICGLCVCVLVCVCVWGGGGGGAQRGIQGAEGARLPCLLDPRHPPPSHAPCRPKPSIEEVVVRVDAPAILMEEAAPQVGGWCGRGGGWMAGCHGQRGESATPSTHARMHPLSAPHWSNELQLVSEASMRAPEEVFRAEGGGAPPKADEELSREERRQRRSKVWAPS